MLVPPALHQDIQDIPVLIDGPPEVVPLATDPKEYFVQVPRVARSRAPPPELVGIALTEFTTPFPDGLIRHDHPAGE
jgi:hypothetical protein